MKRPTVIFHHLPRTGGTTLTGILLRQFRPGEAYVTSHPAEGRRTLLERFRGLPEAERLRYRLIYGHGAASLADAVCDPVLVTMLRDPVGRVVSVYESVRRETGHPFYKTACRLSLEACFKEGVHRDWTALRNGQSAFMGMLGAAGPRAAIPVLAGICECFDESLHFIAGRLGFRRHLFYDRKNVNPRPAPISPDLRRLILEHNGEDAQWYARTSRELRAWIRSGGMPLRRRLLFFRTMNRLAAAGVRFRRMIAPG